MRIIKRGNYHTTMQVACRRCNSVIEVADHEWKKGYYGSEQIVTCPVCHNGIIKPGTGYQGDF